MLGIGGALMGGLVLSVLVPGSWAQLQDEFMVWCVASAAVVLALATGANVLELALDLETS